MTASPKPSRLARWSLILGMLAWAVWCVYFVIFSIMLNGGTDFGTGLDTETLGYLVVLGGPLITSIIAIFLPLVGLILGIRALIKRDPQRGTAIAGLVFSLACLLPYLLFFLLLAFSGIGNS